MSVAELFGPDLWEDVGRDLRGVAGAWWDENRETLVGMARDELAEIMGSLRKGDTAEAKLTLVAHMSPAEWRAYRDGTTETLRGIAKRRADLLDALEDLSRRAAKLISRVVLGVLGI